MPRMRRRPTPADTVIAGPVSIRGEHLRRQRRAQHAGPGGQQGGQPVVQLHLAATSQLSLDPYADVDAERLISSLGRTRLRGTPGDAPVRYSNFGAGLLGLVLGRVTGQGYEASSLTRVIEPLGLTSTSFDDEPLRQGHHRGRRVAPWHLASMAGAGGLRAPASDLLTFLESVRDGGGPQSEAIAETVRPRSDRGPVRVGLGWFLLGGDEVLMHHGGTLGAQ